MTSSKDFLQHLYFSIFIDHSTSFPDEIRKCKNQMIPFGSKSSKFLLTNYISHLAESQIKISFEMVITNFCINFPLAWLTEDNWNIREIHKQVNANADEN